MKYLKFFLICLFSFSLNAKTLELPKVTAEYVCNTKFIIGVAILETRTFQGNNKKRIDTIVDSVPQSVIIDYEKQEAIWVWPKTYSYLSVPLNKESQTNLKKAANITELEKISNADSLIESFRPTSFEIRSISSEAKRILLLAKFPVLVSFCHFSIVLELRFLFSISFV